MKKIDSIKTCFLFFVLSCTARLDVIESEEIEAEGEVGSGEIASEEFSCQVVSWCTDMLPSRLGIQNSELPRDPSGTLSNGVYRLEEGGGLALAYYFQDGNYIEMSPHYSNVSGTFELTGGKIKFNMKKSCSDSGEFDIASDQEAEFMANGDEFYFLGSCGLEDVECTPNQRFIRVGSLDNLCDTGASFGCVGADDCECDFEENAIPEDAGGDSFCGG